MTRWLIDSSGNTWPASSAPLAAVGRSMSLSEYLQFAVAKLGFAQIVESPRAAHLSWRPTLVTEAAFAGTMLALGSLREGRVVVSTLGTEWSHRICASIGAAKDAAVEAFRTAVSEHGGPFTARRRRPESLPQASPLGRLCSALPRGGARIDPLTLWAELERNSERRYVLLGAAGESAPLKVIVWGRGYRTFDDGWLNAAAGASLEDQPDRAYGRWAAKTYRAVERAGEPRVDEVEASIWVPGRGRTTARYTRLVLPIDVKGRGRCILSTAQPIWMP